MKRNWKKEMKDWWDEHKTAVKTGAVCLTIGTFYGFVKGVNTMSDMLTRSIESTSDEDSFEYTEENVDDPELLELINSSNEEA